MPKTLALILTCILLSFKANANLSQRLHIPVEKHVLDNGLTVLLSEDHSTPFVAVNLWYNVGAKNERRRQTGLAHLFEHKMFGGSRHVPDANHFRLLEKAGAVDVNASTSFDRTNYYETVPRDRLELALSLEASRMLFLNIDQKNLDEQREVVFREAGQRVDTMPYGIAAQKAWQTIFTKDHPFHGRVIGSTEDLAGATLSDVQNFYDNFYGPTNASLALVGDFNKAEALTLVKKYFATLPKGAVMPKASLPKVVLSKEEIIRVDEKLGKLPLVRIQYVTPALFEPGDADLDIVSHILTGGEFGRLTKAITRDKQLASSVAAYQQSFEDISIFTIDAVLNPNVDENVVVKEIDQVLANLITDPPTKIEIERARNSILTTQFFGLQNLGSHFGKAEILQTYNRFANNPDFIQQDIMRYNQVDSPSLQSFVAKYLPVGTARKILFAKPVLTKLAQKGNKS